MVNQPHRLMIVRRGSLRAEVAPEFPDDTMLQRLQEERSLTGVPPFGQMNSFYLPLLVLQGIYHYWKYYIFFQGT